MKATPKIAMMRPTSVTRLFPRQHSRSVGKSVNDGQAVETFPQPLGKVPVPLLLVVVVGCSRVARCQSCVPLPTTTVGTTLPTEPNLPRSDVDGLRAAGCQLHSGSGSMT